MSGAVEETHNIICEYSTPLFARDRSVARIPLINFTRGITRHFTFLGPLQAKDINELTHEGWNLLFWNFRRPDSVNLAGYVNYCVLLCLLFKGQYSMVGQRMFWVFDLGTPLDCILLLSTFGSRHQHASLCAKMSAQLQSQPPQCGLFLPVLALGRAAHLSQRDISTQQIAFNSHLVT